MSRVCFVQLPHDSSLEGGAYRPPSVFPVGVASLSAALRARGHEVSVVDCWAYPDHFNDLVERVRRCRPDLIGISSLSTQYWYAKRAASVLAPLGVPMIFGGAGPTLSPRLFLEHTPAHFVVVGEGEETLPDVLANLDAPDAVLGIAFKRGDGEIVLNAARPYVQSLDSLPLPDYSVFDMRPYLRATTVKGRREVAHTVITSRGCPYTCGFCSLTFRGARYRSAESVLAEIDALERAYGPAQVKFSDELLLVPRRRAEDIAEGLARRRKQWSAQGRINIVDRSLLAYLKRSGCKTIGYGIESGSDRILKAMNKRTSAAQIRDAVHWTVAEGLDILIQLIFGYPGEDEDSLRETEALLTELQIPAAFSVMTPLPGSPVYDDARARGLIADEDAYLDSIREGYLGHRRVALNFTSWSDDEFHDKKAAIERRINRAAGDGLYQRRRSLRHPRLYIPRYGVGAWVRESMNRVGSRLGLAQ